MTEEQDAVVRSSEFKVSDWLIEFNNCLMNAPTDAYQRADDLRYNTWEGQSGDGRKHGSEQGAAAVPWENACDGRYPIIDGMVELLGAVCVDALDGARVEAVPQGMEDKNAAQWLKSVLDHYRQTSADALRQDKELTANWMLTYGLVGVQVGWQEHAVRRYMDMDIAGLLRLASAPQAPPEWAALPQLIMGEATEQAAVDVVVSILPDVTRKSARRCVRELRNTGATRVPRVSIVARAPFARALKYGEDVFWPDYTTDIETARWVAVRCFMGEVELREKVATEDWDPRWVDAVIAGTAGYESLFNSRQGSRQENLQQTKNTDDRRFEVIYLYRRIVDDEGVTSLQLTILSAHLADRARLREGLEVEGLVAWDGELDGEEAYPFVVGRRETTERRLVDSRGVPEIAMTFQYEAKGVLDAFMDWLSMVVLPPVATVGAKTPHRLRPGEPIKIARQGEVAFLELGNNQVAPVVFQMLEFVDRTLAKRFGIPHAEVAPAQWQPLLKSAVAKYLSLWQAIYRRMMRKIIQNADPAELERIAGPAPAGMQPDALRFDVQIVCDVRDIDPEHVEKKLDAVAKGVVPMDVGGVIDRTKLIQMILSAIDRQLPQALMVDQASASQAMFQGVRNEVLQMAAGNLPQLTENDPAAKTKLAMVQQVLERNPKYQAALSGKQDPRFAELLDLYVQNLTQSAVQERNKLVGRLGVDPEGK